MDQLPNELLVMIMDYLSTKQLFAVMYLCSRWKEAAEKTVSERKVLAIGVWGKHELPNHSSISPLYVIRGVAEGMRPLVWKSIQKVSY